MKTYVDAKQREKQTQSEAREDILIKHEGTKDKLTNYWTNNFFTVAKVNGLAIIV